MSVKKFIATMFKFAIAAAVLVFLGMESLNFFTYTAPKDQPYVAYLGFGLTSIAFIGYMIIFLWDADTPLKKTIALIMMAVCLLGELATAGFGMQINAWQKNGFTLTQEAFDSMIMFVRVLGMAHGLALVGYFAGEQIINAFRDDDGDGVPNAFDGIDNRTTSEGRGKWHFPSFKRSKSIQSPVPMAFDVKQVSTPSKGNGHVPADPTDQPRQ
jgi:hypothetical protein